MHSTVGSNPTRVNVTLMVAALVLLVSGCGGSPVHGSLNSSLNGTPTPSTKSASAISATAAPVTATMTMSPAASAPAPAITHHKHRRRPVHRVELADAQPSMSNTSEVAQQPVQKTVSPAAATPAQPVAVRAAPTTCAEGGDGCPNGGHKVGAIVATIFAVIIALLVLFGILKSRGRKTT